MEKNKRFWFFINGDFVKITLRPGEALAHHTWCNHEEGYSATTHVLFEEGGAVWWHETEQWRDCDGPGERYSEYFAHDLNAYEGVTPPRPMWQEKRSSQRDIYAENAGY